MEISVIKDIASFGFQSKKDSFKVILRCRLAVFRAAVFFHDLEDLIPEPNRLVHVVDADAYKWRRDRLSCSGVLGEKTHAVGHFLALHPTGGTHGVSLQELRRHLCCAADAFEPLPGLRVNFLCLQNAAVPLLG